MKRQVVVIGGGESFDSYKDYLAYLKNVEVSLDKFKPQKDWKDTLSDKLGKNYEVLFYECQIKQMRATKSGNFGLRELFHLLRRM